MELKLKVIIDNQVYLPGLKAEHGFSILIETPEDKILFDTGQSSLLIENSIKMGIDLKEINKVVLSHGHYDHTGGLLSLLEYTGKEVQVYGHPGIFDKKYARRDDGHIEYIGIQESRSFYEKIGARFFLTDKQTELEKNIFISGHIPRVSGLEHVEDIFLIKENGSFMKDEILDDLSLIINSPGGNVLITGCAHSGLINTVEHAEKITGQKGFKFIGGGFHLSPKGEDYDLKIIKQLKDRTFEYISPAHCTGTLASCLIKQHFGSKMIDCYAGRELNFEL